MPVNFIPDHDAPDNAPHRRNINLMNEEFYQNCAIAAMQGILESGIKLAEISVMFLPKRLATEAFNIADAMMEEYRNRKESELK